MSRHITVLLSILSLPLAIELGCSGDDTQSDPPPTTVGPGTTTTGTNAGGSTSASGGATGGAGVGGTGGTTGTGAAGGGIPPLPTETVACLNQIYECGDLVDNDSDGLVDYQDPDCLGPCDNTEDSLYPNLPGSSGQNCDLDCFWDQGQGHDWDCYWDHQCDPNADLANNESANPQSDCSWDSANDGPVGGESFSPSPYTCDENFNTQPQECLDKCEPLAPNGCDCFGCCELAPDTFVWLGSTEEGTNNGSCTLASVGSPTFLEDCHPCTPVPGCFNDCGTCELCVGKTTLPPECFPSGEGGAGGSGGSPQDCPDGIRACGLPGQDPCPSKTYCITGCCVPIPE